MSDEMTPSVIKAELKRIVQQKESSPDDLSRAFELFIQRQDMIKFSHDFNEMHSLLGPADETDPFNWSEFNIEDVESVNRLEAAMSEELKVIRDQEKVIDSS